MFLRTVAINYVMTFMLWTVVGRTEPTLDDLGLVFDDLHIALSELRDYVENVESKPFAHDVVEFPTPKPSRLQPVEQEQVVEATDHKDALQTDLEGMIQ